MSYPQGYDHPNFTIRREHFIHQLAGATLVDEFRHFQKIKLIAAHAVIAIAGTSDTWTIKWAAGSALGTMTLGTESAGAGDFNIVLATPEVVAANGNIDFTNAVDATGRAFITMEYEVLPDAVGS